MPTINMGEELEPMGRPEMVFRIESVDNAPTKYYVIYWGDQRGITCSCPAGQYGRTCKHAAIVPMCQTSSPGYAAPMTPCTKVAGHEGIHSWQEK